MKERSRLKILLFGPSKVGKSTYKSILLNKDVETIETPRNIENSSKEKNIIQKIMERELAPKERKDYQIINLPGREEDQDERLYQLSTRVVGSFLFYDASNPSSAQELLEMTEEELIETNYIRRQTGLVILGNKRGPVSLDAVWTGKKVKDHLNSIISKTWRYDVPHLIISCQKRVEVFLTFWLMARLVPSHRVPKEVVKKYAAKQYYRKAKMRGLEEAGPQKRTTGKPTPSKSDMTPSNSGSVPSPPSTKKDEEEIPKAPEISENSDDEPEK